jgi:flagellar biosynthesis chaperone FliJ
MERISRHILLDGRSEPSPHGRTKISLPTVRSPRRRGELLRGVTPNYQDAMKILKESFECPRDTTVSHCTARIEYPKHTKDSSPELSHLVHAFKQHICALTKLGESYSETSAMIYSLLLSKVSSNIRSQWKMTLSNKELLKYVQFLSFLGRLARSNRSTTIVKETRESEEKSKRVHRHEQRGHAFTASQAQSTCHSCRGPRPI